MGGRVVRVSRDGRFEYVHSGVVVEVVREVVGAYQVFADIAGIRRGGGEHERGADP